jgi:hypothetical protein
VLNVHLLNTPAVRLYVRTASGWPARDAAGTAWRCAARWRSQMAARRTATRPAPLAVSGRRKRRTTPQQAASAHPTLRSLRPLRQTRGERT